MLSLLSALCSPREGWVRFHTVRAMLLCPRPPSDGPQSQGQVLPGGREWNGAAGGLWDTQHRVSVALAPMAACVVRLLCVRLRGCSWLCPFRPPLPAPEAGCPWDASFLLPPGWPVGDAAETGSICPDTDAFQGGLRGRATVLWPGRLWAPDPWTLTATHRPVPPTRRLSSSTHPFCKHPPSATGRPENVARLRWVDGWTDGWKDGIHQVTPQSQFHAGTSAARFLGSSLRLESLSSLPGGTKARLGCNGRSHTLRLVAAYCHDFPKLVCWVHGPGCRKEVGLGPEQTLPAPEVPGEPRRASPSPPHPSSRPASPSPCQLGLSHT